MANRNYRIKQLLQIQACTNCQACAEVCPAVAGNLDGNLSAVYRMKGISRILKARTWLWRKLIRVKEPTREELRAFSDTVFRCTLCGSCQEVCPVGIELKELWHSVRRDLVDSDAYPGKINIIRENLKENHNVFGEDNEERADWVEDIPDAPSHGYLRKQAEVIYFTGCVAAFFPMAQRIPIALAEIFDAAKVDFTLLGEDEWCCGFPLLGAGLRDLAGELMNHNVHAVREKGAQKVVFACPSCYQMWQEYYPREFEIAHVSEFLNELIKSNRIPLQAIDLTVTYHDPCDLGRGRRIFEAPREVIRSIPGVKLVELSRNRENCQCCGGGGNLEMIDAELSAKIAKQKIEEILATGAQAVVTSCQQCVRIMTTYTKRNKIPIEVMDISQLVYRAFKG
ncbi:MAG: (Fe-S)-binding protein [Deltaproteobacteria bacterium]|nr:(Fe-S)-binding protein [Deltaproteobacteria bacterium]MBW2237530.1 (Fe-S)-binding protein [Deltaproteobacteria bacterium]MBW2571011.1 (Fe-S)-binding protein [Deltaproteobacteria bacterium]MBW2710425.1 (Fe-S)-binding protein [Deltaproteobacteria bacterium]